MCRGKEGGGGGGVTGFAMVCSTGGLLASGGSRHGSNEPPSLAPHLDLTAAQQLHTQLAHK